MTKVACIYCSGQDNVEPICNCTPYRAHKQCLVDYLIDVGETEFTKCRMCDCGLDIGPQMLCGLKQDNYLPIQVVIACAILIIAQSVVMVYYMTNEIALESVIFYSYGIIEFSLGIRYIIQDMIGIVSGRKELVTKRMLLTLPFTLICSFITQTGVLGSIAIAIYGWRLCKLAYLTEHFYDEINHSIYYQIKMQD